METIKAFWRYDWALNRGQLITIMVIATLWPWAMAMSQKGMQAGAEWAGYTTVSLSIFILVIPGILLGYVSDLGRIGAPFDFRHFSRALPVDHGRWALAKIVSVLSWGVVAPSFLLAVMTAWTVWALGKAEISATPEHVRPLLSSLLFLGGASAGAVWSLLSAALMSRGQSSGGGVFLGAAVFFCGELLVRSVASIRDLGQSMKRIRAPWESASEIGLCLLLTAVLAWVFVHYHKNRRPWQACGLAVVALVAVDGARAWLWR